MNCNISTFYYIIISIVKSYVSTYKKYSSFFFTWFSNGLKVLIKAKKKNYLHFKYTNLNDNYTRLSTLNNQCKALMKKDYTDYL